MLKAHNKGCGYFKMTFNAELVGWVRKLDDGVWYATVKLPSRDDVVVDCDSFHEALFVFNDYNWKSIVGPRIDGTMQRRYEPYKVSVHCPRWSNV